MKKSTLKEFIKSEILYELDLEKSIDDEASKDDVLNQQNLNKELAKTVTLSKEAGLSEMEDEDDSPDDDELNKKAMASAKKSNGKFKKLELAVRGLKDITSEMQSLARKYSESKNEVEKEKIKNMLKLKTPLKKELESMVSKLEQNVV